MLENPKHELFAQALVASKGNLTSAYAQAYPKASYRSCRQGGWLLSKNVNIQRRLRELLEQNGLGLEACIRKLNTLTQAERFHHYKNGAPVYQPDNYVRLQSVQTALKIHILVGSDEQVGQREENKINS